MKGVEFLTSNKLVENTPASVAQFLRTTNNLDKVRSLDYISVISPISSLILNCLKIVASAGYDW